MFWTGLECSKSFQNALVVDGMGLLGGFGLLDINKYCFHQFCYCHSPSQAKSQLKPN